MAEGSGEFSEAFLGSISSFQVRSLTPGQTYRFQLCGTNKGGDGKWSEALEITTPLKWPKAPTGLKVEINTPVVGERSICALLTWSPPAPHQVQGSETFHDCCSSVWVPSLEQHYLLYAEHNSPTFFICRTMRKCVLMKLKL